MTAYGRGESAGGSRVFVAEMKSLNNRHRDIILRIPKSLQTLEDKIRARIHSRIGRGRVEVFIQMQRNGAEVEYDLELNLPLVRSYLRIFKQLSDEFGLEENIGADTLCQMKDVILMVPEEMDMDEVASGLHEALSRALDSLDAMRIQEGRAIDEDFLGRLKLIETNLDHIEHKAPQVVEAYRKRLEKRLNEITQDIELDEGRLIQETAIFAERCDVTEEIVRTRSHLMQFRNYMSMDEPIGRRLDFLIQEINREVNTIGAKASDSSISAKAVEIKAELEKLREQVQNVE
jgi:uncharacterized protein (TIGR00255 family)